MSNRQRTAAFRRLVPLAQGQGCLLLKAKMSVARGLDWGGSAGRATANTPESLVGAGRDSVSSGLGAGAGRGPDGGSGSKDGKERATVASPSEDTPTVEVGDYDYRVRTHKPDIVRR